MFSSSIKNQIEREKADLSVQVIQMSERLEEAEGGAEHQVSSISSMKIKIHYSLYDYDYDYD